MEIKKAIHLSFWLVVMMSTSCSREHLFYESVSRDKVKLNIDWSETAFEPGSRDYDDDNHLNGVTIFAFDAKTHQLVEERPPNPNWQSPELALSPGTYDLILINDSRAELHGIVFDMSQSFINFNVSTLGDTVFTDQPDYLAVSAVKGVSFQPAQTEYHHDMPDNYYRDYISQEFTAIQKAVTKRINVTVLVKGMNYCKGMMPSYITGLAKSVNLATRKTSEEETVYAINLINREFRNDTYTEATLTQSFRCFGFNEKKFQKGTKFELTINFVLVDNSIHTVKTDITEQFKDWYEKHSIDVDLNLDINVNMEVELPEVQEEPKEGEGLDAETIPWNDIIQNIVL